MMNLPVKISMRHRGKVLGLDSEAEKMTLVSPIGEQLGVVSWEAVVDFIQGHVGEGRSHQAARNHSRSHLAAKVRCLTPDHKHFDSVTCEIGGGGVFIETTLPSQIGTALALELVLPDDQTVPITAQGKVAWIRPREEHHVFFPGMGIQFTEISEKGRARIVTMVKSLDQARRGS